MNSSDPSPGSSGIDPLCTDPCADSLSADSLSAEPLSAEPLYHVATFYKFVSLPDYEVWRDTLLQFCLDREVKGTILLAPEGINGTIAGVPEAIVAVLGYLKQNPELQDLSHRKSVAPFPPFERMKVKLKQEIVTLGVPEVDPTQQVGQYVDPQVWNILLEDPTVTVIDTRNDY